MEPIPITDPRDPRVAHYLDLRDHRLRQQEFAGTRDRFIAEGPLLVERLLDSGLGIHSILLSARYQERSHPLLARLRPETPAYLVPDEVMLGVVGFDFHRGIMACGVRPPALRVQDLLSRAQSLVILEDLSNQDNVGSVFRNAAALGGSGVGVLLSPGCCDPLYRKALRVSMGAALAVPFARVEAWPEGLREVREGGFEIIALTPDAGAEDLRRMERPRRPALLLGAEGPGLTPGAFQASTRRVRIPMSSLVDSLNVATAGAVAMSHLLPLDSVNPGGARGSKGV